MITRIQTSLAARRDALRSGDHGFTLIELLVVVIIIGILAAIAIPVYIGVQNNAKDSSVKSDIANLKTAVVSLQTTNNKLPAKFTALDGTKTTPDSFPALTPQTWAQAGATLGTSTKSLSYGPVTAGATTGAFCIIGVSSTTGTFYATDTTGVTTTACTIG